MTPPLLLAARQGFEVPGTEAFYGGPILSLHLFGIDLSINRTVIVLFLATAITFALFALAFRKPKIVPHGLQNLMELAAGFVRDNIVLPVMGAKGLPFLPFITTLFFFIFFCNIFEIVPGLNFPATARFGVPLALSLVAIGVAIVSGIRAQGGIGYVRSAVVPSDVPVALLFLLVPIEIVTTFILRPFSLAVRVMANMVAGHLMLTVFFLGTAYLYDRPLTWAFGALSMVMSVVLVGFEIFVAGLQAFIFSILTAVYIAGSVESDH